MKATLEALESTVAALADSYDQLVFLQHAVHRAVNATDLSDLMSLTHDAQVLMEAGGSAMYAAGHWNTEVPGWLVSQPTPSRRVFELDVPTADAPAAFLGVPFGTGMLEIGWIAFWDKSAAFTAGDARLAENLATLIASTLGAFQTRQRQLHQELEEHDRLLATRIWRNLVAERLPAPAQYLLVSRSQPAAQVGGDFQFALGDWIMVGDVSGKGIAAALFTGMFVSSLQLAVLQEDVGAAIAVAIHAQLEAAEMLATLAVIHLQEDGGFKYLNMGHPPLLIRRADGSTEALKATAPPLGTFALPRYPMLTGQLAPGDLLCLYSDGISEAQRDRADGTLELFKVSGLERTLNAARNPEHGLELIEQALQGWNVQDDLTVVLVQYAPEFTPAAFPAPSFPFTPKEPSMPEPAPSQPQRLELRADTSELSTLGTFIKDACSRLPRPGLPELAVTELAANAILHGGAQHMSVQIAEEEAGYLLTFEDDGEFFDPTQATLLPPGELREGGYGLMIVQRSTDRVQYRRRAAWNSTDLYYRTGAVL